VNRKTIFFFDFLIKNRNSVTDPQKKVTVFPRVIVIKKNKLQITESFVNIEINIHQTDENLKQILSKSFRYALVHLLS